MTETVIVSITADQLYNLQPLASVDSVTWWCRLCAEAGPAHTQVQAQTAALQHLTTAHQAVIVGD